MGGEFEPKQGRNQEMSPAKPDTSAPGEVA